MRTPQTTGISGQKAIERVFYNFHDRLCYLVIRHSTHSFRSLLEHIILFLAISIFCTVILCHRTFVYRGGAVKSEAISLKGWNVPNMCLKNARGFREDVDVTHIVILKDDIFTMESIGGGGGVGGNILGCLYGDADGHFPLEQEDIKMTCGNEQDQQQDRSNNLDGAGCVSPSSKNSLSCSHKMDNVSRVYNQREYQAMMERMKIATTTNTTTISVNADSILSMTYSYSDLKGFLYLDPLSLIERNITSQYAVISTSDSGCLSDDPILKYVATTFDGILDTIAFNWILGAKNGTTNGFIFHHKTGDMTEMEGFLREYSFRWPTTTYSDNNDTVSSASTMSSSSTSETNQNQQQPTINRQWHHHYIIFKAGVFFSTLFLFFITTTLVSFTLRETQDRMLCFTLQLNHYVRRRHPISNLIVAHVVENMVFVPIMIGTIFFLMDCFYNGDKFLAFIILSGVWICEVFSAVSMRTIHSSKCFPQAFFLYFTLFHVYYFSCPFGFSYTALVSTVLFQLHSMLFFWNRYELPAILSGQISRDMPRMPWTMYDRTTERGGGELSQTPIQNNTGSARVHIVTQQTNQENRSISALGGVVSYPSMSSLVNLPASNLIGQDENGNWILRSGEVVTQDQLVSSPERNH